MEVLDEIIETALETDFLVEIPTQAELWEKPKAVPKEKTVVQPFQAGRVPPAMAQLMKCKRR